MNESFDLFIFVQEYNDNPMILTQYCDMYLFYS